MIRPCGYGPGARHDRVRRDMHVACVFTNAQLYVAALQWGSLQNIHFFVNNFQIVDFYI